MAADDQGSPLFALDLKILSLNISGLRKKTSYLRQIISKYCPDIICLQETNISDDYSKYKALYELGLDKEICFFNYPLSKSNGTAILCNAPGLKIKNISFYDEGRTTILIVLKGNIEYTIINVYSPTNSTQRRFYFDELFKKLERFNSHKNIIIAGDFNITLEELDIQGGSGRQRIGRLELKNIVDTYHLIDAFREKNPDAVETTFENKTHLRSARLDRIYVSNEIPTEKAFHIASTLNFTDHKGIFVHLTKSIKGNNLFKKKYVHWKFNDSLLENSEFVYAIKDTIKSCCFDSKSSNILQKFDMLYSIFKRIAIKFSSKVEKQRTKRLEFLNSLIKACEFKNKILDAEHFHRMVQERDAILHHKYKGACVRSRLPIAQERPTKAFLTIESGIQKSRTINEIQDDKGKIISDLKEIPNVFKKFYTNLYSLQNTEPAIQDIYLGYTRKLSNEQRDVIDQPLTVDDLKNALFDMREEASPGPNGLTVKFFKYFFDDLRPMFKEFLEAAFQKGCLTNDFKLSYTKLLPKDGGSLLDVKNFRPISLLNIAFKMITKAISNKIAPFLEDLVHPDQAANIKGRSIQNHNHYIRDIISLAKLRGDNSCILSIDQQKAFDRVSHEWMMKVLKENNFGPYFLKWISILNDGATSKILLNNTLSTEYTLYRGVRQGDVMSPILYILTLEPLLEKIRQDVSITGLHIPNKGC